MNTIVVDVNIKLAYSLAVLEWCFLDVLILLIVVIIVVVLVVVVILVVVVVGGSSPGVSGSRLQNSDVKALLCYTAKQ